MKQMKKWLKISEILKNFILLWKRYNKSYQEAILEIYRKLKPGDPATVESGESLLHNLLFDSRRYDLAKVGRYKFNKKLALRNRLLGQF